jgi:hypothetical protein
MTIEIGRVEAIFRYPVKSMSGERVDAARIGWHGVDGDRRLAFRRTRERGGFPWLTASTLPDLLLFTPVRREHVEAALPTHVRTPDGKELAIFGEELAADIERRHSAPVEMMHLPDGIFDDASISIIAPQTVEEIGRLARRDRLDVRRFRPNIVVRLLEPTAFQEDNWLGGVLLFGDPSEGPQVSVTAHDVRCGMVNFDPDSGHSAPEVLKAIVRANQNNAGVYGTVVQTGMAAAGQSVRLSRRMWRGR